MPSKIAMTIVVGTLDVIVAVVKEAPLSAEAAADAGLCEATDARAGR